jgi:putative ABC transport system ATP-binding protein
MTEQNAVGQKLAIRELILARNGRKFARVPDIELTDGVSVALVGASGSGKSTALMAIAGVRRPAHGAIVVDRTDIWTLGSHTRDRFRGRRIGLVFQSFHLVDALSVRANIWLAAQCAGYPLHDPERLAALLDQLGLADIRDRRADHLSHGQAQRVAVARALINRPAVVLADEPTSALDDINADALIKLLTDSARSQKAALVVATHDRRVLNAVDKVVEMEALL